MRFSGIDHDKCLRRERLTAARGRNVVPLRFVATGAAASDASATFGNLPEDVDGAIKAINRMQPKGAKPLTADDVWLHYVEAANKSFIQKYWMFFTDGSLKNFAADAMRGVAFMNSHRTGDISTPSELPFGATFGGRYEAFDDGSARTTVGVYMRKGIKPNGENGPSTDDLHAQIEAGIQREDSVGVPAGGKSICAVCGNGLNATDPDTGEYLCSHMPGTPRNMTSDDRKRMKALGVPNGYAAYWLDGAHLAEVSAVYAGALPGAGVRKVLGLAKSRALSTTDVAQARKAYGFLLTGKDFGMDENMSEALVDAVARGTRRGLRANQGRQAPTPNNNPTQAPPPSVAGNDEVAQLKAQLAAQNQSLAAMQAQLRNERALTRAKDLVATLRGASKLSATEQKPLLALATAVYALCEASPDMVKMADAAGAEITLAAGLEAYLAARPTLQLGETLPDSSNPLFVLGEQTGSGDKDFNELMESMEHIVGATNKKGGR